VVATAKRNEIPMQDSKERFSDRVQDYIKYRPTYPVEALRFAREQCQIDDKWVIADVGSGTGISTEALLSVFNNPVYAVEPNEKMRAEAERKLQDNPRFYSINGSSECTNLQNACVNLIAAFQAFHWFDKERTKIEFQRILKHPKWVLLVWNDRKIAGTPFLDGYDKILRNLPDYLSSSHKSTGEKEIKDFIRNDNLVIGEFSNAQLFDFEGLKGRFFSSSYTPKSGTEEYERQIGNLEKLFENTNVNGKVEFLYTTQVYMGMMR
jgi:ubiquinone/menaquinone biosynthesis C-methylase UbiE